MNSRDRILAVLDRLPVDRLPVDLWHTPEVAEALRRHTGAADDFAMWQVLGVDKIVWVFMAYQTEAGESAGSQVGAQMSENRTMWGVPLRDVKAGEAHYQEFGEPPMAGYGSPSDVDAYPYWPDPDRFDYDAAEALARRASREFAVIGPWVSIFEIYCQLRGIEQALMDLAVDPDFVACVLDRIEAVQTEMMHRFFGRAAGVLDLAFVSDDIGGQNGLLLSPEMWRRHLQPRLARWCELIHSYGVRVFYHTDGGIGPLVGDLIDCGIDVLNPIQHACPGMDMGHLKEQYGGRVVFHGGVDNQRVLPFGTVAEVREETGDCLRTLGAGGEGYICCSCHNVQAGTPVENVVAMVETVQGY